MKISVKIAGMAAFCAFALAAPAFAGCALSPADFAALRQSRSELADQSAVDAMADNDQALVCSTRALVADVEKNGGHLSSEPGQFSTNFMSPQEIHLVDGAVTEWLGAAAKAQSKLGTPAG